MKPRPNRSSTDTVAFIWAKVFGSSSMRLSGLLTEQARHNVPFATSVFVAFGGTNGVVQPLPCVTVSAALADRCAGAGSPTPGFSVAVIATAGVIATPVATPLLSTVALVVSPELQVSWLLSTGSPAAWPCGGVEQAP